MQADLKIAATDIREDTAEQPPASPPDHRRPSIDLRSASLMVIALLAGLYTLRWAGAVIIPVLLAVMASYAASPVVERAISTSSPASPNFLAAELIEYSRLASWATCSSGSTFEKPTMSNRMTARCSVREIA